MSTPSGDKELDLVAQAIREVDPDGVSLPHPRRPLRKGSPRRRRAGCRRLERHRRRSKRPPLNPRRLLRPFRGRGPLARLPCLLAGTRSPRHHLHCQRRPLRLARRPKSPLRGRPVATLPVPSSAKRPGLRSQGGNARHGRIGTPSSITSSYSLPGRGPSQNHGRALPQERPGTRRLA